MRANIGELAVGEAALRSKREYSTKRARLTYGLLLLGTLLVEVSKCDSSQVTWMTSASPTTNGSIPYSIEQFLLEHVATHEQLQALVWLLQHPEHAVTAPELEAKIGIPELELQDALGELVDSQLVARSKPREGEPRYRYAPARSDLDAKTRLLAILYQQDRYEVVRVLGENAMQRMWNAAQIAFLAALSSESGLAMHSDSPPDSVGDGGRGLREARGRAWKLSSPGEKPNSARRWRWRGVER